MKLLATPKYLITEPWGARHKIDWGEEIDGMRRHNLVSRCGAVKLRQASGRGAAQPGVHEPRRGSARLPARE